MEESDDTDTGAAAGYACLAALVVLVAATLALVVSGASFLR
jgi:hypothetical protein